MSSLPIRNARLSKLAAAFLPPLRALYIFANSRKAAPSFISAAFLNQITADLILPWFVLSIARFKDPQLLPLL